MISRFLSTLLFVSMLVGCAARLRPVPLDGQVARAVATLDRWAALAGARQPQEMARIFTPHCLRSCRGFVPFIIANSGGYQAARWSPRLEEGTLVVDLAQILMGYRPGLAARLQPLEMRTFPGRVMFRARLILDGTDMEDMRRTDRGLVDLELRKVDAGWRIHEFRPTRVITLRRDDVAYGSTGMTGIEQGEVRQEDFTIYGRGGPAPWAVLDVDGDGRMDLVTARSRRVMVLRGRPGGVAKARTLFTAVGSRQIRAIVAGDLNGDGRTDLFIGSYGGASKVWLNGPRRFRPQASFSVAGHVTAGIIADFDSDGWLDLYVVRHGSSRHRPTGSGEQNMLFRGSSRGPGRGVALDSGWGLAACAGDLDGDGDLDLFVANEFGRSRLYLNSGRGRFGRAALAGALGQVDLATSCAVGDVDGDGRFDLYVGGRGASMGYLFGRPRRGAPGDGLLPSRERRRKLREMLRGGALWMNRPARGRLRFIRVELHDPAWGIWSGMVDHDNDGDLDVLVFNHGPRAIPERRWWWEVMGPLLRHKPPADQASRATIQRGQLWINLGQDQWTDGREVAGLPRRGRIGAVFDLDRDGDLDLVMDGEGGPTWRPWQGAPEEGRSAMLRLIARGPNRAAVGSRVEVTAGGRRQLRLAGLSSGIPGGPPGHVHFGMGEELRVEQARVRWPDGTWQVFNDLPVNQLVTLRQGGNASWDEQQDTDATPAQDAEPAPAPPRPSHPLLPARPLDLTVTGKDGPRKLSQSVGQRSAILMFRASTCEACKSMCKRLAALARKKPTTAVLVVTLGRASDRGCGVPRREATAATARAISGARALLPLVILVDSQGSTRQLISGSLESSDLEGMVDRL